jgi:outer membrane protein assembly factor BamB
MAPKRNSQPQTLSFSELTIWKTKLPDIQFAILPPFNDRPNPLATESRIYVSVFSPGAVCALQRADGRLIWRRELPKFGSSSVYLEDRRLFAKTANTLFAMDPDAGEILWSFSPYGREGESIYSSPSSGEGRVYIGDRMGWLHCLDAASGETIWKRRTNRTENCSVNSTPVLINDLVIVSTNAKTAIAYEAQSGKQVWQQHLNAPSGFGPLVHRGTILAVANSLIRTQSKDGKGSSEFCMAWLEGRPSVTSPYRIVLTFQPDLYGANLPSDKAAVERVAAQEVEFSTMILVSNSGVQRTKQFVAFCPHFRYEPTTRFLYMSHLGGVDVFHPTAGRLIWRLKTTEDTNGGVGAVDTMDNKLYVLTGDGTVHALGHPVQA